jgi:hypothetical protein
MTDRTGQTSKVCPLTEEARRKIRSTALTSPVLAHIKRFQEFHQQDLARVYWRHGRVGCQE